MEEAVVVAIDMAVVVADPIDMEVVIPDMSIIVKKLNWWSDVQAEVVLSERRVFVRGPCTQLKLELLDPTVFGSICI